MPDRRTVLKQIGLSAAGLLIAPRVLADPYGRHDPLTTALSFKPVRVRGRVTVGGTARGGVAVSDGLSVTSTTADGSYELVTSSRASRVFVTLPGDAAIPRHQTGTARIYHSLAASSDETRADFDLQQGEGTEQHAFLLLADPQTLDTQDVAELHATTVPDVRTEAERLAERSPFVVACGDIMYDNLEHFPGYERAVAAMGLPAFQVVGNHDCEVRARTDALSVATFARHFGPTYYSFERGEVHYVVLDDVFWFGGYIGYLDQVQLDWLRADLALIESGRTVVVFMHIPVYCENHLRNGQQSPSPNVVITNRELLYRLLEPFRSTVICGHMHYSEYLVDGGCEIHMPGAVCGAWWTGPVCYDGTPRGYAIYEVDGSDLKWRYKSTGEGLEKQMLLYPPGVDPGRPESVIANVWSADSRWSVRWYQDGDRKGAMERYLGSDPLATDLYTGQEKPEKHGWVEPVKTDHLFAVTPDPGAREIVVEATDGWGQSYRELIML